MLPPLCWVFRDRLQQVTNDTQTQGKEIQLVRKWFSRWLITTPRLGTCGCEGNTEMVHGYPRGAVGAGPSKWGPLPRIGPASC